MTRRGWCGKKQWQHGGNGECVWLELLGHWCVGSMANGTVSVTTGSCWGARAGEHPVSPPCASRQSDQVPANLPSHPATAMDPQSTLMPRVLGLEHGGQWTAPLTAAPSWQPCPLPNSHRREGAVLLVACPASAAARDSDGQTRSCEWRGQACTHTYGNSGCQRNKYICFGNAVSASSAVPDAESLKVLLVTGPYSFLHVGKSWAPSPPLHPHHGKETGFLRKKYLLVGL